MQEKDRISASPYSVPQGKHIGTQSQSKEDVTGSQKLYKNEFRVEQNSKCGGIFRDGFMEGVRFLSEHYSVENEELKMFLCRSRLC